MKLVVWNVEVSVIKNEASRVEVSVIKNEASSMEC
jgi:hypothetical protein